MAKEAPKNKDCWLEYFTAIKKVCPWSLQSYLKGKLDIQPYFDYKPLGDYEARVYIYHLKPRQLQDMMEQLNEEHADETWFWAYPHGGEYDPSVPILIQQDTKYLESIRSKLKSPI